MLTILVTVAIWVYVEWVARSAHSPRARHATLLSWHRAVFVAVILFAGARLAVRLAFERDLLDPGAIPLARRAIGVASGVLLALWGNYLPKLLSPWILEDEPFDWQGVHRFVGWVATLGGTAIVLVWIALPLARAGAWSRGIVAVWALLGLGRKLYSIATYSEPRDRAASRSH